MNSYLKYLSRISAWIRCKGADVHWGLIRSSEFFSTPYYNASDRYSTWLDNNQKLLKEYEEKRNNCSERTPIEQALLKDFLSFVNWAIADNNVFAFLTTLSDIELSYILNQFDPEQFLSLMFFTGEHSEGYKQLKETYKQLKSRLTNLEALKYAIKGKGKFIPASNNRVLNRIFILDNVPEIFNQIMVGPFSHEWYHSEKEKRKVNDLHDDGFTTWKQAFTKGASYPLDEALIMLRGLNHDEMQALAAAPWSVFYSYFKSGDDARSVQEDVLAKAQPTFKPELVRDGLDVAYQRLIMFPKTDVTGLQKLINSDPSTISRFFDYSDKSVGTMHFHFGGEASYNMFKSDNPEFFDSDIAFFGHIVLAPPHLLKRALAKHINKIRPGSAIVETISEPDFIKQKIDVLLRLNDSDLWSILRPGAKRTRFEYVWPKTYPKASWWEFLTIHTNDFMDMRGAMNLTNFREVVEKFFKLKPLTKHDQKLSRTQWIEQKLRALKT